MLELRPDLEARFVAEAKAKGVPVHEVVKAYLYHAPLAQTAKQPSADEIDKALDEATELIPEGIPPLSDQAMSSDSIYTREDDWNR